MSHLTTPNDRLLLPVVPPWGRGPPATVPGVVVRVAGGAHLGVDVSSVDHGRTCGTASSSEPRAVEAEQDQQDDGGDDAHDDEGDQSGLAQLQQELDVIAAGK